MVLKFSRIYILDAQIAKPYYDKAIHTARTRSPKDENPNEGN